MSNLHIPVSAYHGVVWPALPPPRHAPMFALLQQFEHSQWWPPETLERYQLRQLETLADHALRTVPFYRERLRCLAGLGPGELTLDRWREVPLLRRTDIQDAKNELHSKALPRDHLPVGEISTSGSTGSPVTVKTTRLTATFFSAVQNRYHLWHRREFAAKTCAIKVIQGRASDKPANWVTGYPSGPLATFDITRPVSEQFAWLVREAPDYLLTYPNNLRALLELSESTGAKVPRLRQVATMSEVLDPELRAECERLWGVSISDVYSAMEIGVIAMQCPDNPTYHIQSEGALVEVLTADGTPCGAGEIGRMVVTDLSNFACPLIRYEIGDYAEVGEPCRCGRGLPVLNRILGRSRNMLRLPSGDRLWPRFGSAGLAGIAPIRQQQLVQKSFDEIVVNLVVARALTADEENDLRAHISPLLGHPFTLVFNYVDEIPRSANGKFEDFRCDLDA